MEEIIIKQTSGTLDANFEEVKAQLNEQLDAYKRMVFTEETKKDAKDTVAELRKGKKELADRCKEVKNEWMIPLNTFMAKADELAKMFDEPINYINGQIDAFEQKRIAEKREVISNIYAELVTEEEIQDIIPLNKIYNAKWENATFKDKDIREEIMNRKLATKTALETIKSMHSEMESKAIEMYKVTFDMSASILYMNQYEAEKREILEREKAKMREEEEERIRAEERRKLEAELKAKEETARAVETAKAEVIDTFVPTDSGAEEKAWQYTLMLTPDAKEKVEMFLNSIGVEYFAMEVED